LEVGKKYKSDQNYVDNFSFPKMDDDLGRREVKNVKNPEI
jgi:hypothetical protein